MNELLETMGKDLSVFPYKGEEEADYLYRVCYSALALWMLYAARSSEAGEQGISKKAQTEQGMRLLREYEKHLGLDPRRFEMDRDHFLHICRRVYEEIGYLYTDEKKRERVVRFGRTVTLGDGELYFGLPEELDFMRGLGLYTHIPGNEAELFEILLRDTLTVEEYLSAMYEPLDFERRDIHEGCLRFFDPLQRKSPSTSWGKEPTTSLSLAEDQETRTRYRVLMEEGELLFAEEPFVADRESLPAYETRRLYFALKRHYKCPVKAWFHPLDGNYCRIDLSAQLPQREYYFLLLCAWPRENAFRKNSFITTADMLPAIEKVLRNIGTEIERRK